MKCGFCKEEIESLDVKIRTTIWKTGITECDDIFGNDLEGSCRNTHITYAYFCPKCRNLLTNDPNRARKMLCGDEK